MTTNQINSDFIIPGVAAHSLKYDISDDLRVWESIPPTTLQSYSRALALDFRDNFHVSSLPSTIEPNVVGKSIQESESKKAEAVVRSESYKFIPACPFHLFPTHISWVLEDKLTIDDIIKIIDSCLCSLSEYDFVFDDEDFLWKGKYLQGSSHCLIEVRIYKDCTKNTFYIETNRTNGDARPFHNFFRELKVLLSQTDLANCCSSLVAPSSSSSNSRCSSIQSSEDDSDVHNDHSSPISKTEVSSSSSSKKRRLPLVTTKRFRTNHTMTCEAFVSSIQPIIKMTESPYFETKLEAGRMLCDFTTSYDIYYLCASCCIEKIITAVESLLLHADGFHEIREQAIMIIALFIEYTGYEERIIQSEIILSTILSYLQNPSQPKKAYETAQIRRESARIFYLLTIHQMKGMMDYLLNKQCSDESILLHWLSTFDTLKDYRLKSFAMKAREMIRKSLLK